MLSAHANSSLKQENIDLSEIDLFILWDISHPSKRKTFV